MAAQALMYDCEVCITNGKEERRLQASEIQFL